MPRLVDALLVLLALGARLAAAGPEGGLQKEGLDRLALPNVTEVARPPAPAAPGPPPKPPLRYLGKPKGSNIGEAGTDDRGCERWVREEERGPINFGGYRVEDRSPDRLYCYCFVYRLRPEALDGGRDPVFLTDSRRMERHNCSEEYVAARAECAMPLPAKGELSLAGLHRPGRWAMVTECEQEKRRGHGGSFYYDGHHCSDQLFGWTWEGGRDCSRFEEQGRGEIHISPGSGPFGGFANFAAL